MFHTCYDTLEMGWFYWDQMNPDSVHISFQMRWSSVLHRVCRSTTPVESGGSMFACVLGTLVSVRLGARGRGYWEEGDCLVWVLSTLPSATAIC